MILESPVDRSDLILSGCYANPATHFCDQLLLLQGMSLFSVHMAGSPPNGTAAIRIK